MSKEKFVRDKPHVLAYLYLGLSAVAGAVFLLTLVFPVSIPPGSWIVDLPREGRLPVPPEAVGELLLINLLAWCSIAGVLGSIMVKRAIQPAPAGSGSYRANDRLRNAGPTNG